MTELTIANPNLQQELSAKEKSTIHIPSWALQNSVFSITSTSTVCFPAPRNVIRLSRITFLCFSSSHISPIIPCNVPSCFVEVPGCNLKISSTDLLTPLLLQIWRSFSNSSWCNFSCSSSVKFFHPSLPVITSNLIPLKKTIFPFLMLVS